MSEPQSIPTFLSIDVEPNAFQLASRDEREWSGYSALFGVMQSLRDNLAHVTGVPPMFGWYYRMDPQIEATFGRADVAMSEFGDRGAALQAAGDYCGVHAHPLRWSAGSQAWVHDFGDPQWLRECTEFSLDAFEKSTGTQARLYRAGAGFLSNEIVEVLDDRGVVMEMSLESVASWGLTSTVVPTAVDTSPIQGQFIDCREAPQTPYQPDPADFRRRGTTQVRRIVLVPMSTGPRMLRPHTWKSKVAHLFRPTPEPPPLTVLYPTLTWPSDRYFWDVVSYQLDTMRTPYLSLGIRTDAPDSELSQKVYRLLAALPNHPVAKRLQFVNPLSVGQHLASA